MQGRAFGYGRLVMTSGISYVGEWMDDRCHGFGKYINKKPIFQKNSSTRRDSAPDFMAFGEKSTIMECCEYEGQWEDDLQHGHGVEIRPDGSIYDG
jgi:hypothetical protein